jgi:tripartite-type tricarboxylate transporter receptor subunit TctC
MHREERTMMKFFAIRVVAAAATALILSINLAPALAADIPCSTAKLIVPWNAGGDTDIIFRLLTDVINATDTEPKLQVVNISGQSGNKGAKEVKSAKPDGCTLLAIHESQITTYLAGRVDFTWDAFTPVARLTYTPSVLGGHSDLPFDDLTGLVEYAKQHPGELKAGVTTGSTSQFINLLVEDAAGVSFKYVPYEGTRERLTALLSKNIDIAEMNILTAQQYIKEGSMKAFGIATDERDPVMPDLKTFKEQGIDVTYGLNRGIVLPQGTSADIVKHYEAVFGQAMQSPEVQKVLEEQGTWNVFTGSEEYAKFFEKSYADHEKVAIKIGMFQKQ